MHDKKKQKKKRELSESDLKYLMNCYKPTYKRVNGRVKQR